MADKLLVIEHDADTGGGIARYYRKKGWQVEVATSVEKARHYLLEDELNPHVIIADLGLPDGNILDYLEELHQQIDYSEWVFAIAADGDTDMERIDELAYDFLEKPFDQRRLDKVLKRALRASQTTRRLQSYSAADTKRYQLDAYVGNSEAVRTLKDMLRRLAEVPISTMIITGETGTGKGLAARIIHHTGLRKNGPLVELNCAALPRDLIESELFGHEAGAFTGAKSRHRGLLEQADGGTLFLDEIGDMDIDLQTKLLKAIEDRRLRRLGSEREITVDAQIIAATGINLEQAAAEGRFREDLYHRLSVFCVTLPPLRERKDDLVEMLPSIVAEYNAKANKHVEIVPDEVWEKLLSYGWPGNVRELRNVIERCVLLSSGEEFPIRWLQLEENCTPGSAKAMGAGASRDTITIQLDGSMSLDAMDSHIIQTALQLNSYNIAETARVLGTTRETLRYRIQKYDLQTS
ncbi:sigma-54-dependent Fis family transcriptional regulator [Exilibacterium tricleocarpae]|uniref:Sigma-54-dependent Fis family transcriptional regulator n=1 Tax=Exilibacterium tricleocarpae TaxID=2591008 RepID=A0A545TNK8_9GAMM|nr:sigma-54 dependent transcriptional regulator [Exilibacterium tricleocarpae]TQV78810.1 sigma-54-dependent Fis family transcriptional regulator [Exilibacterium tricleocarpae]